MTLPFHDWQFWAATALAFAAAAWLLRGLPRTLSAKRRNRPPARRVSLTIHGEKSPKP